MKLMEVVVAGAAAAGAGSVGMRGVTDGEVEVVGGVGADGWGFRQVSQFLLGPEIAGLQILFSFN